MTAAIDIMNYLPLVAPGLTGPEYASTEFQIMLNTTFKKMAAGGTVKTLWGREVPILDGLKIEEDEMTGLGDSEDTREGVLAFVEKREPNFVGR